MDNALTLAQMVDLEAKRKKLIELIDGYVCKGRMIDPSQVLVFQVRFTYPNHSKMFTGLIFFGSSEDEKCSRFQAYLRYSCYLTNLKSILVVCSDLENREMISLPRENILCGEYLGQISSFSKDFKTQYCY